MDPETDVIVTGDALTEIHASPETLSLNLLPLFAERAAENSDFCRDINVISFSFESHFVFFLV